MALYAPRTPSRQQSQEQPSPGLITLARGEQPKTDLEIKRPHFLARTCRMDSMDEAQSFIVDMRSIYPDACHHCSTLALTDLSGGYALATITLPTERFNNDGEPSGTTGQPMLNVSRGTGLANAIIVVTRYFGGTLLGAGGPMRAYPEAAAQALQAAARVTLTRPHLRDLWVPVVQAGRIEAELHPRNPAATSGPTAKGGTVVSAPTIHAEETI